MDGLIRLGKGATRGAIFIWSTISWTVFVFCAEIEQYRRGLFGSRLEYHKQGIK